MAPCPNRWRAIRKPLLRGRFRQSGGDRGYRPDPVRPSVRFTIPLALPEALSPLLGLATNLRWTWDRPTQELFRSVSPELWEATRGNPVRMLHALPPERARELAGDEGFRARLADAVADLERYLTAPSWYETLSDPPALVAYFSPEFGVSEVLPQYSGGLGVLAGDHLKAASDLGVPLVAVGLLYRYGYFRQRLNAAGMQVEEYEALQPSELPLELDRGPDGSARLVSIQLPGATLWAQVWRAQVGRVPLLLLDSHVPQNAPGERDVSDRLYGGDVEHRLRQEILLGIGGVRALRACGYEPEVFHTNEGHAGFLGLERIRELVQERGLDVRAAVESVRAGTIFTTHTPVPAGIDRFPIDLVERYFGPGGVPTGLELSEVVAFGAEPGAATAAFNMAVMGLRLAARANGVSRLHGQVSRAMFAHVWPGFEADEAPVGHITNGVHGGTWIAPEWDDLYVPALGDGYRVDPAASWDAIERIPDDDVWAARRIGRNRLVEAIRAHLREVWSERGLADEQLAWIDRLLDPEALTIGFARRVPSYKRLTLILREEERLTRLLRDRERPLQLVVAGKAHPADMGGKQLIQEFAEYALDPAVHHRIVFLPDYDMAMARLLVSGVDVWLNNPVRPLEACGTSGMKAALNGVLNLSIRDGWWDELYDGRNGWAIPSADDPSVPEGRRDELEARALLDLLETEVIPRFYDRRNGVPADWVAMAKHSIASLGPAVTGARMVRDYVERLYAPAARASRAMAHEEHATAREVAGWKERVRRSWPGVQVLAVEPAVQPNGGGAVPVRTRVALGDLDPADVEVQVGYGPLDQHEQLARARWETLRPEGDPQNGERAFVGAIPVEAGAFGCVARVVPRHPAVAASAELGLVAWSPGDGSAK
jgi:glycogen phosphorylase